MGTSSDILTVHQPCEIAVNLVSELLTKAGLSILRTFDLQVAQGEDATHLCECHDGGPCDCQMVVLLAYPNIGSPVTIIGHGNDTGTVFSLVNTPQQRVDPRLEAVIHECFVHSNW